MSETLVEVLAAYREREHERVPLREVGERVGMDRAARSYAVKQGVIRPAGRAGMGGGYVVTRDDALLIVVAALVAAAAGIAIVTALRGLVGAGLKGAAAADAIRNMTA
jgi:hypothetical protein